MKKFSPFALSLLFCTAPAFAAVTVNSPLNNSTVGTPFVLTASASPCSNQAISAMGYSLDAGVTTIAYASSINAQVTSITGSHVLHVKSWGIQGASCTADVAIYVSATAAPALYTDVTVAQPTGKLRLVSPFALHASGTQCKSQAIAAMGYSIDNSSNTTIVNGATLNAQVSPAVGSHTLHVKSWGNKGSSCVNDVAIRVVSSPASNLPPSAIASGSLQTLTNWQAEVDLATGANGATTGVTSLNSALSLSGTSRQFFTSSSNNGGERYHLSFGADSAATNFLYDAWLYIASGSANIANLEFDMNQVMANGQTVIYGFQCDSWSKTWDYTANTGTPQTYNDVWLHSAASCNVQEWTPNIWHHLQISYSRDAYGNVSYGSVWLDNVEQDLNIKAPSSFALGWSPTLLTNFQVDGNSSGTTTSTVYMDKLTVYHW